MNEAHRHKSLCAQLIAHNPLLKTGAKFFLQTMSRNQQLKQMLTQAVEEGFHSFLQLRALKCPFPTPRAPAGGELAQRAVDPRRTKATGDLSHRTGDVSA